MVEYKLKISSLATKPSPSSTDNDPEKSISVIYPETCPVVVIEIRGNKNLADKIKKFIEDNAEPEDWEVY